MAKTKKPRQEKICVVLSAQDKKLLEDITKHGNHNVRMTNRARILLLSNEGKTNTEIVSALSCAPRMICNVRRRYSQCDSILDAIKDAPRPGQPRKITPRHEAFVIATACTDAPPGHNHWTLGELKKELLKRYKKLRSISDERIRHILIASALKPWREKNVVHTKTHTTVSRANG
jgi:transposase